MALHAQSCENQSDKWKKKSASRFLKIPKDETSFSKKTHHLSC